VTNFKSSLGRYNYAPSPDGKQIAVALGNQFNDIVLIKVPGAGDLIRPSDARRLYPA
jgi:hypothetical protein